MASNCGKAKRTNVGTFDCDLARLFPLKLIMGGKKFPKEICADPDAYRDALLTATELDTDSSDKLFAINVLRDPQDTTPANQTGAVGEGPEQVLVEGKPSFTYRVEIGQDLFKRLRRFNKRIIPIYTYDDGGNNWGAEDSGGNHVGAQAKFFISGNTQQTASTPVSALITVTYLSASQYHDEAAYVPVVLSEFEPRGLLDAELKYLSNAANVFKIKVEARTAQLGVFLNYAKEYSSAWVGSLFSAATGATFATPLTITSVAYDATLACLTVTFDSTAYTALAAAAKIRLSMKTVADLKAANITGIEGVPVVLTKS